MKTLNPYGLQTEVKNALLAWWERQHSPHASGADRADRAEIKRQSTLDGVACTGAYQRIYRQLLAAHTGAPWREDQKDRLAAVVGLAAHVRERCPWSLPHAMHQHPEGSDRTVVSELRFKRLVESPDLESLFTGLRRTLPLIGHKVDVGAMADDVFEWGERVKKRWAYAYYDNNTAPRNNPAA
jgi:CRISPR system Cascade subunit CasB